MQNTSAATLIILSGYCFQLDSHVWNSKWSHLEFQMQCYPQLYAQNKILTVCNLQMFGTC